MLLFSYYKPGFRCFELNLFLHCLDLKYLNLNKRSGLLKKDLLFTLQLTWSDQMSQMYVGYASRSDSSVK